MSYLSLNSWSLHRLLGPLHWTSWDAETQTHQTTDHEQPLELTLLELPAVAAAKGYQAIEVCHFHFPSTDAAYLEQLKDSFSAACLSFDTLLVDYGDLTSPEAKRREADYQLMQQWIDVAAACGAKQVRIIAGEAEPTDHAAIRQSAEALVKLVDYGAARRVKVLTENFKLLTSVGDSCMELLEQAGASLDMITDFGNFSGPAKYEDIGRTALRSVSIHVKAMNNEHGHPNQAELRRCLDQVQASGFDGAYVLVYDGPGDMWEGLERVKAIVQPYIA
ncbi:TIM barrel protein [Paenibacillus sp. KS-LC4]|uniref:sugar phosphate isomerase/epimerase family protein n=1 Tax=Paenibacillus sp. KS-LC4 TaxID=2979727 RepID=UPI0030CCC04F